MPHILLRCRSNFLDLSIYRGAEHSSELRRDLALNSWFSPSLFRRARRLDLAADLELISMVAYLFPPSQEMDSLRELVVCPYMMVADIELPAPLQMLPGITDLTLHDYIVPWKSPLISVNLTHLSLIHEEGGPHSSYYEVRAALSLLHSLEEFEMRHLAPLIDSNRADIPVLTLPQSLQRLSIETCDYDSPMDRITFVSLMRSPTHCVCHFFIDGIHESVDFTPALDKALGQLFHRHTASFRGHEEVQHLVLTSSSMLLASTVVEPPTADPKCSAWQLDPESVASHFQLDAGYSDELPAHFLSASIAHLSNMSLDSLHTISFDMTFLSILERTNLWTLFLGRAVEIRHIGLTTIEGDNAQYSFLLDALRQTHDLGKIEGTGMLVPRLEVLAIPLRQDETRHIILIHSLTNLVRVRHELGTPLRELVVPKGTEHWDIWSVLRATLKVTFIDYPLDRSPFVPNRMPRS